jgi:hypothetical protein
VDQGPNQPSPDAGGGHRLTVLLSYIAGAQSSPDSHRSHRLGVLPRHMTGT